MRETLLLFLSVVINELKCIETDIRLVTCPRGRWKKEVPCVLCCSALTLFFRSETSPRPKIMDDTKWWIIYTIHIILLSLKYNFLVLNCILSWLLMMNWHEILFHICRLEISLCYCKRYYLHWLIYVIWEV